MGEDTVKPMNTKKNGTAVASTSQELLDRKPPPAVEALAEACVKFVERALGVRLDYCPETLPVLDHYLEQARSAMVDRIEAVPVVAQAAGAYLGEVVRRRHASWWRAQGDDATDWQIEFEAVYLAWKPVLFIQEALLRDRHGEPQGEPHGSAGGASEGDAAAFVLQDDDREAVAARLAELPSVSDAEYYAPSTRIEVIDIVVEAIRARRMAQGEELDDALEPADYEQSED